jgi:cell division protein FtsB
MRNTLIVLHILLALAVVVALTRQLGVRAGAVSEVRAQAQADHQETASMKSEAELQRNLLAGLRGRDPYVVELLARERLGYTRPGELSPPPAPAVDSPSPTRR